MNMFFIKYEFLFIFILIFLIVFVLIAFLILENFLLGTVAMASFISLFFLTNYFSTKFTKEKTEQLLQIKTINEVEYILKDVPAEYLDRIYKKLRKERLNTKPTIEIEETLEKMLQEKNNIK